MTPPPVSPKLKPGETSKGVTMCSMSNPTPKPESTNEPEVYVEYDGKAEADPADQPTKPTPTEASN